MNTRVLKRIDLNLYVVFEAIYRYRSITKASDVLFLSQPAVSQALARLRDEFDDPLFERRGKEMRPTPFSDSIIQDVKIGLGIFADVSSSINTFVPAQSDRKFTIALPQLIEANLFGSLLERIDRVAPGISLESTRVDRAELSDQLASGVLDLAVDVTARVKSDVTVKRLASDKLVVLVRRGHPVTESAKNWGLDSYLNHEHVYVSTRHYGFGAEDRTLAKLGKQRIIRANCQHFQSAESIIRKSDLMLTVPMWYARLLDSRLFDILPLPFDMKSIPLFLYWFSRNAEDPGQVWLRELFLDVANKLVEKS